jgi:hypothetical protein
MGGGEMMKIYRHGDVLLKQVAALPNKSKKLADKVLAYGEVTGHKHQFGDSALVDRYQHGEKLYLQVYQPVPLNHEEHNTLIIDPGVYEQITEREYDPFLESIRTVID